MTDGLLQKRERGTVYVQIEVMGRIVLLYCFDFRNWYFLKFYSAVIYAYIASASGATRKLYFKPSLVRENQNIRELKVLELSLNNKLWFLFKHDKDGKLLPILFFTWFKICAMIYVSFLFLFFCSCSATDLLYIKKPFFMYAAVIFSKLRGI